MADNIIEYIKSVRAAGHSDKSIKTKLLSAGYSETAIKEAYAELNKKPTKLWLFVFLIILTLIVVILFILRQPHPECDQVWLDFSENKGDIMLCVYPDNSRIQTMIENKGDKVISNIKTTGRAVQELEINLYPRDFVPIFLDKLSSSDVEELFIIPGISVNNKVIYCENRKIQAKEIKVC